MGLRADKVPIDLAVALGVARIGFPPDAARTRLFADAARWFVATPLDEAEVLVYPYRAEEEPEAVLAVSAASRDRGLPCIFLSWGDVDVRQSVPYGTLYRQSLFDNTRHNCERALAAFCADPLEETARPFEPRQKQPAPSVGFCGYVSNPAMRWLYRALGRPEKALGLDLRARALRALGTTQGVRTDFLVRNSYFRGPSLSNESRQQAQRQARAEFLSNLLENDYTVCIRGAGNYSYRLYETLAAGRIPLFINTKCVLPFDDEIDWREHCVWVEVADIARAGEILVEFHRQITPQQFAEMQLANRRLWEERLSALGFWQHLLGHAAGRTTKSSGRPAELPLGK
jgi:hypothetical protein